MKTLLIAILTTTIITAQNTVTWVGGTPGKTTNWEEAKNWSNQRVPDEFSNVTIPDVSSTTFASPVIKSGRVELNALLLESNAQLTVQKEAKLVVYGYAEGITHDNLHIYGSMLILDEVKKPAQKAEAAVAKN